MARLEDMSFHELAKYVHTPEAIFYFLQNLDYKGKLNFFVNNKRVNKPSEYYFAVTKQNDKDGQELNFEIFTEDYIKENNFAEQDLKNMVFQKIEK